MHHYVQPKKKYSNRDCKWCRNPFSPLTRSQVFCKPDCAGYWQKQHHGSYKLDEEQYEVKANNSSFINFSDLMFYDEEEFADWFGMNFALYGISDILKLDRWFPDCQCVLYDGTYANIELEYYAPNFSRHQHYAIDCDLIASFLSPYGRTEVSGIPVVSVFEVRNFVANGDFEYESMKLSPYFSSLAEHCQSMIDRIIRRH